MLSFIKNCFHRAIHDRPLDAISAGDVMDLDVDLAIVAHESLRRRLLAYLEGQSTEVFSVTEVSHDDRCELGQWIYGRGRDRLGAHPSFTLLMGHHKWFHHTAADLILQAQTDQVGEARQRRIRQFERFSRAIVQDLENLRQLSQTEAVLRRA